MPRSALPGCCNAPARRCSVGHGAAHRGTLTAVLQTIPAACSCTEPPPVASSMNGPSSSLRLRSPIRSGGSLDVELQLSKAGGAASPTGRQQQGPPSDAAAASADAHYAGEPVPPKGLRRLGSKLWGSESSLLRHSSITVFEPTGEQAASSAVAPNSPPMHSTCAGWRRHRASALHRGSVCTRRCCLRLQPCFLNPTRRQVAPSHVHVGLCRRGALPAGPSRRHGAPWLGGRHNRAGHCLCLHPALRHASGAPARARQQAAQPVPRAGAGGAG